MVWRTNFPGGRGEGNANKCQEKPYSSLDEFAAENVAGIAGEKLFDSVNVVERAAIANVDGILGKHGGKEMPVIGKKVYKNHLNFPIFDEIARKYFATFPMFKVMDLAPL